MNTNFGTDAHFVELRFVVFGPVMLLAHLIFKFSVVHHAANRWFAIRRDLDQVESGFEGATPRVFDGDDPDLFAVVIDQANLSNFYLFIDSIISFGLADGRYPRWLEFC